MNFKYLIITLLYTIVLKLGLYAQSPTLRTTNFKPKREFRGVWLATVANIDWPSNPNLSTSQQQEELINLLDYHKAQGINAVFMQVRPAADAFYASNLEPWSTWLNGAQGQQPNPYYDPLSFAIQEAHKRGMELHAWFNPYRASNTANAKLSSNHVSKIHPEWLIRYAGKLQFDPGIPAVQDYIEKVILDVVRRYDIDGVHFDDYFYPYPVAGQTFNDRNTFQKYGRGFNSIDDWRRNNVDQLIKKLNVSIHKEKKWVKFGISPFGIWKNKQQDPEGSITNGLSNYYQLYADSKKWIEMAWVDYINPQLYFTFDFKAAPFDLLANWWKDHTYERHLYIGMAAYRINERNRSWQKRDEMPNQLNFLRKIPEVKGVVFFSSKSLINNKLGISDFLRNDLYSSPALPPTMKWLDSIPTAEPQNLKCNYIGSGVKITWSAPKLLADKEPTFGYVVYRFNANDETDKNDPSKIIHITYLPENEYIDNTAEKGKSYFYMVTALDHLKNESEESVAIGVDIE